MVRARKLQGFADLHKLPEDKRIEVIAQALRKQWAKEPDYIVGIAVDDLPGKADRYAQKILAALPEAYEVMPRTTQKGAFTFIKIGKKVASKAPTNP